MDTAQCPADHVPEGYVVSSPVVVEAFQDQRFKNITRKWRSPYLPGDGAEFWAKVWDGTIFFGLVFR